ncbi:hypothetical protein SAMN06264364_11128 [Quadrisphaera granulorum]|uniref:Uncharacterized protein n=1 Tax=Quadrisphaera granulorum TaxID=317664 RepID=A0A316A7D2_9ACTN|nr:hypothetical protein [Quadrisphaera granulorum]PWJ53625.1 hypothetical protein BXY45_11128 [Quadrisphaera granulorum]SZE96669.1 hypothetical protein SAMN06264364_11128 [Quadrisphaera granulorum]
MGPSYTARVAIDSDEERAWGRFAPGSVERRMLVDAGAHLGVELRPRMIRLDRARVEVEGIDAADRYIAQLVANQGAYKPAFRNKVMADFFKLLWLRQTIPGAPEPVLVIAEPVRRALAGWVGTAAAETGITVLVWGAGANGSVTAYGQDDA